ncbi:MAG TPA: hypothetical protein VLO31_06615, partial [Cryobacterium sp.]|nr:hypothetical protein [Cryobacterium sp.]
LKSETRWSYVHLPDGTLKWTSPTGRTFLSEPATIIRPAMHPAETQKERARHPDSEDPAPF